jgi:hypothetical protein
MSAILERSRELVDRVRRGHTTTFSRIAIPREHIIGEEQPAGAYQPDKHYFQVRVNEMYLAYDRQWWARYMPMVFSVTEFIYDKREEAVPFVVGSSMMEKYGQELPANMVFDDTRVAGLHPYRGGALKLSLILYQVRREDYARNLLSFVESITGVLNVSLPLNNYVKIANIALDGLEGILGLQETVPLLGMRKERDPDANDRIEPGYFALIDVPDRQLKAEMLWVKDHRLHYGSSRENIQPYQAANFVLYSLVQTPQRGDVRLLPFYAFYEQLQQDAGQPYKDTWKRTLVNMTSLAGTMLLSPDLTMEQAEALGDEYETNLREIHSKALKRVVQGPGRAETPLDARLRETLNILNRR